MTQGMKQNQNQQEPESDLESNARLCRLFNRLILASILTCAFFISSRFVAPFAGLTESLQSLAGTFFVVLQFFVAGLPVLQASLKQPKQKLGLLAFVLVPASCVALHHLVSKQNHLLESAVFVLFIGFLIFYLEARYQNKLEAPEDHIFDPLDPQETVTLILKSKTVTVAKSKVNKDDVILVEAGQEIPFDGIIVSGTTSVDHSPLSGESRPKLKDKGDRVSAGTINQDSQIQIQVVRNLSQTLLNRIQKDLKKFSNHQSPKHQSTEKNIMSVVLFGYAVTALALFYQILFLHNSLITAAQSAMAIVLAFSLTGVIPSLTLAYSVLARNLKHKGIHIKDAAKFDDLAKLSILFFDKGGTLTKGSYEYSQSFIEMGTNQGLFLSSLFSLEAQCAEEDDFSEALESHPWFHEVSKHTVQDFKSHAGLGICGTICPRGEKPYFAAVGNLRFLKRMQMSVTRDMKNKIDELEAIGETVLLCGYRRRVVGLVSFSDIVRPHVKTALRAIKNLDIAPAIITGESAESLNPLIESIGIQKVYTRCTPEEKVAKLKREKEEFKQCVGFIGDVEDDLALMEANVSFSIGTGGTYDHKANIAVLGSDIRKVSWLLSCAKWIESKRQTFFVGGIAAALTLSTMAVFHFVSPELVASITLILHLLMLKTISTFEESQMSSSISRD